MRGTCRAGRAPWRERGAVVLITGLGIAFCLVCSGEVLLEGRPQALFPLSVFPDAHPCRRHPRPPPQSTGQVAPLTLRSGQPPSIPTNHPDLRVQKKVIDGLMCLSVGAVLKKAKPLKKLRPDDCGSPFAVKGLAFLTTSFSTQSVIVPFFLREVMFSLQHSANQRKGTHKKPMQPPVNKIDIHLRKTFK